VSLNKEPVSSAVGRRSRARVGPCSVLARLARYRTELMLGFPNPSMISLRYPRVVRGSRADTVERSSSN